MSQSHMRYLYQIFVHVTYGYGSVLLQHGKEIQREGAILGVSSLLTMHCNIVTQLYY